MLLMGDGGLTAHGERQVFHAGDGREIAERFHRFRHFLEGDMRGIRDLVAMARDFAIGEDGAAAFARRRFAGLGGRQGIDALDEHIALAELEDFFGGWFFHGGFWLALVIGEKESEGASPASSKKV